MLSLWQYFMYCIYYTYFMHSMYFHVLYPGLKLIFTTYLMLSQLQLPALSHVNPMWHLSFIKFITFFCENVTFGTNPVFTGRFLKRIGSNTILMSIEMNIGLSTHVWDFFYCVTQRYEDFPFLLICFFVTMNINIRLACSWTHWTFEDVIQARVLLDMRSRIYVCHLVVLYGSVFQLQKKNWNDLHNLNINYNHFTSLALLTKHTV